MTSVLQTYARNPENPTPIDVLLFRTEVRKFYKDNIQEVPKDGKNIPCFQFLKSSSRC